MPGRTSLRSSRIVWATTCPAAFMPASSWGVSVDIAIKATTARRDPYDLACMAARILLLGAAIALVALAVGRTHAHRACDDGRRAAFAIGAHREPATGASAAAQRLIDRCRGAEQLVDGV